MAEDPSAVSFRRAAESDAVGIAELHADSWRRNYRGAYSDGFLDGDVFSNRRDTWRKRLLNPAGRVTIVAEAAMEAAAMGEAAAGTAPLKPAVAATAGTAPLKPAAGAAAGTAPLKPAAGAAVGTASGSGTPRPAAIVGFIHIAPDEDQRWGSFVDNLHITNAFRGKGVGTALMKFGVEAMIESARSRAMYLWVLEINIQAQGFYRALGGEFVEAATLDPPAGIAANLVGSPKKLRVVWPDIRRFLSMLDARSRR